jgi:hypothetical protein
MTMQNRLPARFPVGTHYILEGEPAGNGGVQITSRYVLMPNGMRYDVALRQRTRKPSKAALKRSPCIRSARPGRSTLSENG